MTINARGRFELPTGSVVVKNFLLPLDARDPDGSAQRIETRVLVRINGVWEGYTYAWNSAGDDAVLVGSEGLDRTFTVRDEQGVPSRTVWHYPSRNECFTCHTQVSDRLLGLTPEALNAEYHYPQSGRQANQLATYQSISLIQGGLPAPVEQMPALARFNDASLPVRDRARAYLAMNCSMCHQPGGPTTARMDFRWTTPDASMRVINSLGYFNVPDVTGERLILPGDPERSAVLYRMAHRGPGVQMPPLGVTRVDEAAVAVIREWILELGNQAASTSVPQ